MNTLHPETSLEEARLYEELHRALEDIPQGEGRQRVMQRMIRQLQATNGRNKRLNGLKESWKSGRPAKLWIWIATGALAPVVFFCIFIWASLWVE